MCNTWLNIRFYVWHLEANNGADWWKLSIHTNEYHRQNNTKLFQVYNFEWPKLR